MWRTCSTAGSVNVGFRGLVAVSWQHLADVNVCVTSSRYRKSQIKAAVKVNQEMLAFYWSLGRDIVEMHVEDRWGESVVRNLSADLKKLNPEAHCFSKSNIYYMKKFYLYCVEIEQFVQQPIGQEDKQIVQQLLDN